MGLNLLPLAVKHQSKLCVSLAYPQLSVFNLVRQRAQLPLLSGVSLQDVWDERRAELAMEEDRFFDLVRTGQAASVLAPNGFMAGKNELLPIPANQRQLNPNLVQNPGY